MVLRDNYGAFAIGIFIFFQLIKTNSQKETLTPI
jgi:hypothetical protein